MKHHHSSPGISKGDFFGLLRFRKPFEGGHAMPRRRGNEPAAGDAGAGPGSYSRPNSVQDSFREVTRGLYSLFTGMKVTIVEFFKHPVTVQYPRETLPMPARFRGHIELVRDPETGKALCFACKLCERSCPSDCITVEGAKLEGDKRKSVTQFKLDFTKCSLCGSCVEACKSNAIRYSKEYNLASTRPEDFIFDLFQRLEAEQQTAGAKPVALAVTAPAPAEPKPSEPKPAPPGSAPA